MKNNRQNTVRKNSGRNNQKCSRKKNPNNGVKAANAAVHLSRYQEKAKEALSNGDRNLAENYFQHADHYQRIVTLANIEKEKAEEARNRQRQHDAERAATQNEVAQNEQVAEEQPKDEAADNLPEEEQTKSD